MNSCWGQDTSYSKLLLSEAATVLAGVKIYSKDTLCPPFVYQTIETMDPKNRNLMLRLPLRMKLELRQEWVRDGQDRTLTRTAELFALYLNPSLLSGSLNGVGGMSGPLFFFPMWPHWKHHLSLLFIIVCLSYWRDEDECLGPAC